MSTEINISPSALGYNRGLFSQTASSTPVAASTTEGSLIGSGIGGPGVGAIKSNGQFVYIRNSNLTYDGVGFNTLENTNFDTTINNQLEITAQWGSTNAINSISSDMFILVKTF